MPFHYSSCKNKKNELHIAKKRFRGGRCGPFPKKTSVRVGGSIKVDLARLGVPGGSKKGQNGSTSFMDAP